MPLQEFNNIVNLLYRTVSTEENSTVSDGSKKVPRRLLRFLAILRPVLVDALGTDDDGKLYIFSSSSQITSGIEPTTCTTTFANGAIGAQQDGINSSNNSCDSVTDSKVNYPCDGMNHTVMNGVCSYRPYQVDIVLKTLNNLIHRMPVKEDGRIMEGRILLTLPFYLDFLEDFLSQDSRFISSLPRCLGSFQKDTIVTSVLSLLYHPIMFLDLKLVEVEEDESVNMHVTNGACGDGRRNGYNEPVDMNNFKYCQPPRIQLFSSLDMSERETASLSCAMRIIELVTQFEPCLYSLYDNYESSNYYVSNSYCISDDGEECESNAVPFALGIVGYLSLGLMLVPTEYYVPLVFSHEFELGKHVPFIAPLLESTDQVIHEKGLLLLRNLISTVEPRSLTASFYEEYISRSSGNQGSQNGGSMDQFLLKIAIFSSEENIRCYARDLYQCLFHCFNPDGMFTMLMTNLCSRIINQYPSAVTFLLFTCHNLVYSSSFQSSCGTKLRRLLQQVIKLSMNAGAETDLCENHDVILESLNLIRFFALKYKNRTGDSDGKRLIHGVKDGHEAGTRKEQDDCVSAFTSLIPEIKKKMVRPLRSALDLSRAHFTLELNKLQNESVKSARNRRMERIKEIKALDLKVLNELKTNGNCKATPNGDQDLLNLPENHEQDIISMSLVKFDLIESILAPVTELLNSPSK